MLERTQRWHEAFHYAMFHGHFAKSLAYMVRAGRSQDVLPMVQRQSALAGGAQCVSVCQELALSGQTDTAVRLSMFCAFGDYVGGDQPMQDRLPYLQVCVHACVCVILFFGFVVVRTSLCGM